MLSVTFCVITAVCIGISAFQIHGLYRFRSFLHLVIIQKRYPLMVQLECIACILFLLIGIPLLGHNGLNELYQGHSESVKLALTLAARIHNNILGHFIADIEATRLFLISYDLHYLNASKNSKWKSQIDLSFAKRDWYLLNRSTWGNKYYVFKRASIYYLCATAISVTNYTYIQVLHPDYFFVTALVDATLVIVPLVVINFTYWKTPKNLNDSMFFHLEYRTTAVAMCTGFLIYISAAMADANGFVQFGLVLAVIAMIMMLSVPSLLSTIWIPFKIERSSIWVCFDHRSWSMYYIAIVQKR